MPVEEITDDGLRQRTGERASLDEKKGVEVMSTSSSKEKDTVVGAGDEEKLEELEVDVGAVLEETESYSLESNHSPYAEVRAVVPEVDDVTIPVNTLRMWILGVVFTMLGSGINQFFSLRYPAVKIVSLVAELVAFPCGVFLAKILPLYTLNLGPLGSFCINPDRHFNIKEHALVTIMANVSFGFGNADATLIIQAATAFYGFKLEAGFKVLIVLCCQLLGFGVAGLSAPWIVKPAEMIWPGVLSNCALLSTLHSRSNAIADGWKISRLRFFMYVLGGAFVWYFFPGMIFTGLSYFTWICWIAPNNLVVNQLFGMYSGLGLSPITFDWSQVAYVTNPLLSPFWAAANAFAGFAIFFWLVVPGIFYTNTWYTAYMPVMSADVYDRFNDLYNTTKVVNSQGILDVDLYKQYSPPYLPAAFAFVYGLSFAAITSVLTHIAIWHGKDIWEVIKGRQQLDIHGRMMEKYKQLPYYYYAIVTVVVTAMGIGMAEGYNTNLPWWGVILALVIPAVYMVPCGLIQGVTNINANQINVLSEFIGGYMFAGKPLANMIFKILSVDVVGQGLYFAQDMKLGHYLKIAPRTLFWAQGIATVLGALTNLGVNQWALANIDGICESGQPSGFSCPNGRTVFSSSVIWGLVGPGRLYSVGKIYSSLLHFFWIGALMPFTTWALYKWTGREFWKLVNWPIIFASTADVPPATGVNYSSWAVVNFVFNRLIFKRYFKWWTKYNYVLAAGLDTGLALSGIFIFFCITYPGAVFPDWWGNTVWANTADGMSMPWKDMPSVGYWGPESGWE